MKGRVLVVAGSDSGGGAGIQADIKTITVLGGYAATAVTALTVQNTLGVQGVLPVEPAFVSQQIEAVLADIGADCIKTGMLHSAGTIAAVVSCFQRHGHGVPLVVDPVMVAKGGAPLLVAEARELLRYQLVPMAAVLTPNLPEAEALAGLEVRTRADMQQAADKLLSLGASAVLLKGGHLEGETLVDLLRTADGEQYVFEDDRIATRSTHGTGCTLASAVAAGIAEGLTLYDAVGRARQYVRQAIRSAPKLGRGHGPLNHAWPLESRDDPPDEENPAEDEEALRG